MAQCRLRLLLQCLGHRNQVGGTGWRHLIFGWFLHFADEIRLDPGVAVNADTQVNIPAPDLRKIDTMDSAICVSSV